MSPLTGLRSRTPPQPTAFAVGHTMSALAGLARQEYVTVFANGSTKVRESLEDIAMLALEFGRRAAGFKH
jgi:hypothetical protein